MARTIAFFVERLYLCGVVMTRRSLKIVHIKVDRDTLQIFYEMPSKALPVMAGLERKVLNSRRITKRVAPSNPVFSRSFITSFGVASYRTRGWIPQCPAPFFLSSARKMAPLSWRVSGKGVYLHRKTKLTTDNEGLFIRRRGSAY